MKQVVQSRLRAHLGQPAAVLAASDAHAVCDQAGGSGPGSTATPCEPLKRPRLHQRAAAQ